MLQRTPDPLLERLRKIHPHKFKPGCHPNTRVNLTLGTGVPRNTWRCPVKVPETGPVIVRHFFSLINERKIPIRTICRRSGLSPKSMEGWRNAHGVNLNNFIAAAEVLGYDVVLKKRKRSK